MKTLHYPIPASLRGDRLETELATALKVQRVGVSIGGGELLVYVPDNADESVVAATIAAHDGSPTAGEVAERTQHAADVNTMQAFMAAPTPTLAQTVAALKAFARLTRAALS